MRGLTVLLGATLLALPAAAPAQYETPVNPPDPAAQLAEMVGLYDSICLSAFPDDDAVARAMGARTDATALSAGEVETYLHEDPGVGWSVAGQTAPFIVTIEAPPYHACAVRTMTANGFPDMAPYQAVADRFAAGKGFQSFPPITMNLGDIQTTGGGAMRQSRGGSESLLVFHNTPAEGHRDAAHSAVEVRFVHQMRR